MHTCVCMQACVFYSYLALSHLSPKISEDHCDFPPDYTPQLFNTFEDKRVCRVSHSEVVFFSSPLWKGHLTTDTVMWQLNVNQWIRYLSVNPATLEHESILHRRLRLSFCVSWHILLLAPCASAAVFSAGADLHCWYLLAAILCSAVTIPRRLRGWTPAWRRRRSPQRSVRTEVWRPHHSAGLLKHTVIPLTTAQAFTWGHTSILYVPHYMIHHFSRLLHI